MKKTEGSFLKAAKMENIANTLKVAFENGEVKYVKSRWVEEIIGDLQFGKKGRGRREGLLTLSRNMWIGVEVTIEVGETVFVNGKDRYMPKELRYKRKKSILEL